MTGLPDDADVFITMLRVKKPERKTLMPFINPRNPNQILLHKSQPVPRYNPTKVVDQSTDELDIWSSEHRR